MAPSAAGVAGRLRGAYTALVTPFRNGSVDESALRELVEFQIAGGINGLVPTGTTGESPTLTHPEHIRTIEVCVRAAAGRVPVLAGTGSNSTQEALDLGKAAKAAGADALLVVAPYYNRPTQRGLVLHYRAIVDQVGLPLVVYNIPSRTGVNVEPETLAQIAKGGGLAGVKEAAGSTDQVCRILEVCGTDFTVLSGDDSLTLPFLSVGARGVISVVSNLAPRETSDMVRAYLAGRHPEALALHRRLLPLIKALFIETNPVPVKTAMGLLGRCSGDLRLPLAPMEEGNEARLRRALEDFGFKVSR
jgi:4-hydroxy-tetrahydrodipicolinate synthase